MVHVNSKSPDSSHQPDLLLTADVRLMLMEREREIITREPEAVTWSCVDQKEITMQTREVSYKGAVTDQTNISQLFCHFILLSPQSRHQCSHNVCLCNLQGQLWRLGVGVEWKFQYCFPYQYQNDTLFFNNKCLKMTMFSNIKCLNTRNRTRTKIFN